MNKNNRPVIVIGIIIIILLAYIALKPQNIVTPPPVSPVQQSSTQTSQSSSPAPTKTPVVKTANATPLIAASTSPYPSPSTVDHVVTGGPGYLLFKTAIPANGITSGYYIYKNNDDTYKTSAGKIYYNPQPQDVTIEFGTNVTNQGSAADVIKAANEKISQNGYVIVGMFSDGGPNYEYYFVQQ